MEFFKCTECSAHFVQDDVRLVQEVDEPDYTVCPFCGSCDYEETFECIDCEEQFTRAEFLKGTDYCVECWCRYEDQGDEV